MVRLSKTGDLLNSRPCDDCIKCMRTIGIHKIYYSGDNGELLSEKICEMKLGHVSAGKNHMIRCGQVRIPHNHNQ